MKNIDLFESDPAEPPAVSANIICNLTKEQIIELSKDSRVRTISFYHYDEPEFIDE